jgi:hypothetical protein
MKINAIKDLVENYSLSDIELLTNQLENGETLSQPVDGDDAGEQLTHLLAASWIIQEMANNGTEFKTELRNFTARVRDSIS